MSRTRWIPIVTLLLMLDASSFAAAEERKPYEMVKLAEGVWAMIWEPMASTGNNLIVINDSDVLVVDSAISPSMARRTIAEVRALTDKPVRTLVITHWHDDHMYGNQAWRDAFPAIEIIAHRNTRIDAEALGFGSLPRTIESIGESQATMRRWLETGKDDGGTEIAPDRRVRIENYIVRLDDLVKDLRTVRTELPSLVVDDDADLVLHRGERTIEIRWLGLGNTRGDLVVYLPREKIVASGDLLVHPVPYGIGSYYREWIDTLAKLGALDVDAIVPGHGPVQRDRVYLEKVRSLLGALATEVESLVAGGASLEETEAAVTLEAWKRELTGGDAALGAAFDAYFVKPAVKRMWRQARGEPDRPEGLE